MSEQQNLRLVQQFYAAFERGDIAGVLNAFADDGALFIPGPHWLKRSECIRRLRLRVTTVTSAPKLSREVKISP
jgi:ketosteroid isomerase-like protein